MAIAKNNASITSNNSLLPILVPSHLTLTKKTDGWVLETRSEYHREANTSEEWIDRMPVTRIPFDVKILRDTLLLDKLPFGHSLTNDLLLADALERDDVREAKELSETYGEEQTFDEDNPPSQGPRDLTPTESLALHVNDGLSRTRYVIWLDKSSNRLRHGILCTTKKQLANALVAGSLGNLGGLGVCKRCGKLFRKRRASQPYCSANCRVAEAMKRYRERKKKHQRANKRTKSTKRRSRQ